MHSETLISQLDSTQSDDPLRSHNAVDLLQCAARSGHPVLIPGALEPVRQDHPHPVAHHGPFEAPLSPAAPDGIRVERDRESGGIPADPVTLLDYIERVLLRLTESMIRLLRTSPASSGIASVTT